MSNSDWLAQHFAYVFAVIFPLFFVGLWCAIGVLLSRIGGWHTLSLRFRTQAPFLGTVHSMQSATFGRFCNYNGSLKIGSNTEGLYLVPIILFRIGHPPLLVPWNEITAGLPQQTLWIKRRTLLLGRMEQVRCTIREDLLQALQQSAGLSLPAETMNPR